MSSSSRYEPGLHLDQVQRRSSPDSRGDAACRSGCRSTRSPPSRMTSPSRSTRAVPCTTTQCSARWWCICSDSFCPGFTTRRFTRKPIALIGGLVRSPGTVNHRWREVLGAPAGAQLIHDPAHVLGALARYREHGILGRHQRRRLAAPTAAMAGPSLRSRESATSSAITVPLHRIAGLVLAADLPQAGPRADIAPAHARPARRPRPSACSITA